MDIFSVPQHTLLEQMAATPRYRLNGLPKDTRNIILFTEKSSAEKACQRVMQHCDEINICGIYIHKYHDDVFSFEYQQKQYTVPCISFEDIMQYPHCLAVLFWDKCVAPDLLYHVERVIKKTLSIAVFPRVPFGTGRKHAPLLYKEHGKELEKIYQKLADDESKIVFASVVKGLLTGEIDWIVPSSYAEYQHKIVCAQKGDIVLDAGLFDSTVLRKFALTIGSAGKVYGFEPEPHNYRFVLETIARFGDTGNIVVVNKGVYSQKDTLFISDEGASGTLKTKDSAGSPCEVIDIDSFVQENHLEKVDLIKMDIEGAEMSALQGAKQTISTYKPKLQICAYHHILDLIDIPQYVQQINTAYKLYFVAHAPYLNEYVYYMI